MSDIKTSVQTSNIRYRIDAKPEGGFVATSSDPGMPAIEGATREEVQQKIEAAITDMISKELPTVFKLGNLSVRLNSNIKFSTRTGSSSPAASDALANSPAQAVLPSSAAPIVPERGSGTVLWIIVGLMVLAALIYFSYLHR